MLVEPQKIEIKWHYSNKKYYEDLGYRFSRYGDVFTVSITELPSNSRVTVKYICDYCHKPKAKKYCDIIKGRKKINKDCCNNHICQGQKQSEVLSFKKIDIHNSLGKNYPFLLNEWDYDKNKKSPYDFTSKSNQKVWWKCDKGHSWKAQIYSRVMYNTGCPICSGKIANEENNLAIMFPELIKEWSPKNKKSPQLYLPYSGKKVWWICKQGHEWYTKIYVRTKMGSGCPYCAGILPTKENNLLVKYPEICKEWDYEENKNNPEEYLPNSNKKVSWVCESGHKWKTDISDRTFSNTGCPYCAGQKASNANNLFIRNPELADQWHPTKNGDLTPYDVLPNSNKKVWWLGKCGHEWKANIESRNTGKGCPICKESKGEKRVRKWLEENNTDFIPQMEYEGLVGLGGGNLSYDFYLPNQNILIEYQGEFHDGSNDYTKLNLEYRQEHDKRKKDYANENNIDLLEIWYWDFDNVEEILENELNINKAVI